MSAPEVEGAIRWMAPELFNENSRTSRESDIFALGMLIYEVLHIFLGKSILTHHPVGPRTQTTVLSYSPIPCAYADPRWRATLTTNEPGDPWLVRGYLAVGRTVLEFGSKHTTSHCGYFGFL